MLDRYGRWPLRELNDLRALQMLTPLSRSYVPWSSIAMRPAALLGILNEVVVNQRRSVVECGGGISTLYLGRLLKQTGGQLTTIEHDATWAMQLTEQLAAEGLGGHVTVVHATLKSNATGLDGLQTPWYDAASIDHLRAGSPVDLLVVDGPPAYPDALRHARYPAVPFFRPRLTERFAVALDDINRVGEQEILERWEQELQIRFERRFAEGRIAIGRSEQTFHV